MKVVGGSFGLRGILSIESDQSIKIRADRSQSFRRDEVASITTRVEKDKKFGCFSFVIGAVILGVIFGIFLNVIGVVIGVVLAGMGSFYTNNKNIVDIGFSSGDAVSVECTAGQVRKLVQLKL